MANVHGYDTSWILCVLNFPNRINSKYRKGNYLHSILEMNIQNQLVPIWKGVRKLSFSASYIFPYIL